MRTRFTTILLTLLTLLAALACAGVLAVGALASTGGAAGPKPPAAGSPSDSTPNPAKVHKTGIATWFGPGFYGRQTACGQTLTTATVGVANRKLPCGTLVAVSFRGQRLTLPVLDRGPYGHNGAEWDLTAGAAQTLGIEATVQIATAVVGTVPNTPSLGLPPVSPAAALAGGAIAG
jgi:rare lipoprotein A (peptidoglycan hydrolase)